MIAKKNSLISNSSGPQSPLLSHLSSTNSRNARQSTRSQSKKSHSRGKKISGSKLFQKAHETSEGQTYLKQLRSQKSSSPSSGDRSSKPIKNVTRLASLRVNRELNIKIGQEHNISEIMAKFGGDEVWGDDLSSIRESGWQMNSETGEGDSLLRQISPV